ncbi:MAG: lyase family protein [Paracoccaceae bacterium]|nr:lyase family protein [Paracoccaceae bacterium]MDE2914902.1 lyase family protein [Paracoccaceae bacterium]
MTENPLFGDHQIGRLLSDEARYRDMVQIEAALASVQADLGIIPEESARQIAKFAKSFRVEGAILAERTGLDGVPVPALLAEFRKQMTEAGLGDHAEYVHRGPTSQDIMDTAFVLCLQRTLAVMDERLKELIARLARAAHEHRKTIIAARTRNRIATPTTLGCRIAGWASPLIRHRQRLSNLRPRLFVVSLAGASGNLSAFEGHGLATEAALAKRLGLGAAGAPWHSARDNLAELASLMALISGSLGKMAQDLLLSAQIDEGISAGSGGGSSTMPHKTNPTLQEAVVALARINAGDLGHVMDAMIHAQEREGSAWFRESLVLERMFVTAGAGLRHGIRLSGTIKVDENRNTRVFTDNRGLMMAEAASLVLADRFGLASARDIVKDACRVAVAEGRPLKEALVARVTDAESIDWDRIFDPAGWIGESEALIDRLLESLEG